MKKIKKLNRNGLSLIELMVSFALSFVILAYLLNIVLMLKNLYLISDEKTNIMIKQASMIKKIESILNNASINSVNTCGNNCIRFNYDGDKSVDLIVDAPNRTIKFDNYKMQFDEGTKLGNISVSKKEISGIDISKEENKDGIVTFKIPIEHAVLDGEYGIRYTFMYNSIFTNIPDIKPEDFLSVTIKGNVASGKATNNNVTLTATIKPNNPFNIYTYNWQKKENGNWVTVSSTKNNTLAITTEVKTDYRVIVTTQEGNTATSNSYNVFIDKTAPKCNVSGGNNTWTNGSRTIKASCEEQGSIQSGCATAEFSKKYDTEMNISNAGAVDAGKGGTVKDVAGNVTNCAANQVVRIDKTKPTCTSSGGSDSWTNGSRTLTGTCSDTGGSGCKGNVSKNIDYETNSSISPGTVSDNAGNTATCSNQTVRIDKTKPTCTSGGGSNSWTNGSRTLTGTCSDTGGSGCKGNVSKNINYETNSSISPGTVSDNAGNTATCSNQTVRIDKTKPTCTSSGGSDSWTNGSRTITGTCSDTGGSGCKGNVTKGYSNEINTTIANPGTVYDNAGNSGTCPNQTVRIDKTGPSLSNTSNTSGGNWTNQNVTIKANASDSLSGMNKIEYSYDQSTWYTDWNSKTATSVSGTWSAERNNTVYVRGVDNVGNVSGYYTTAVRIDKTKPTYTLVDTACGDPFGVGHTWYVKILYTDNLSGLGIMTASSWDASGTTHHPQYNHNGSMSGSDGIGTAGTWLGFNHQICDRAGNCNNWNDPNVNGPSC